MRHQALYQLEYLRQQLTMSPMVTLSVFAGLMLCLVAALAGSRLGAVGLIPLAAAWIVVNGPVEGPTLLVLSYRHGVTVADLLSVLALMVAAVRVLPGLYRFLAEDGSSPR